MVVPYGSKKIFHNNIGSSFDEKSYGKRFNNHPQIAMPNTNKANGHDKCHGSPGKTLTKKEELSESQQNFISSLGCGINSCSNDETKSFSSTKTYDPFFEYVGDGRTIPSPFSTSFSSSLSSPTVSNSPYMGIPNDYVSSMLNPSPFFNVNSMVYNHPLINPLMAVAAAAASPPISPYVPPTDCGNFNKANNIFDPFGTNVMDLFNSIQEKTMNNSGSNTSIPEKKQSSLYSINSKKLEDFRNGRLQNIDLIEIKDDIISFATDQHGSRFIQQKFESSNAMTRNSIFEVILPHAYTLMTDVFGNYIIQKYFEMGNKDQKCLLLDTVRGNIMPLTLDVYGCRVIQKAVECSDEAGRVMIINELKNDIIYCITDQHGNHVIQKIVEYVNPRLLTFIVQAIKNKDYSHTVTSLSKHPYGCRVIQRMLEHLINEDKKFLCQELQAHLDELLLHQYGNYVIQQLFISSADVIRYNIVISIKNNIEKYSKDKFASNVIEYCLANGNDDQIKLLCGRLFEVPYDDLLYRMISDPFGNYVIQKMLDVVDGITKKRLISAIKQKQSYLKKVSFGKHILLKCSDDNSISSM
uniref:PUM-HD domain-containing protein n=1 Tax=Parastrongyloides trichosuri TaxID=131310 RepID=A0A0N4ZPX2_PARTI